LDGTGLIEKLRRDGGLLITQWPPSDCDLVPLVADCPNFDEPLPSHGRSPVGVQAIQVFVAALEGTAPVFTSENMHELPSLCNEIGFAGLLSQVPDFVPAHSVADCG
jgi:hypothetical protein